MKNFPKILILLFLIIFVLQIICLFFLLIAPVASHAASAVFKPQVGIGEDFEKGKSYIPEGSTAMIGKYIRAIYKYAIGIIGILAAVVLMIGGILWIMAGGNATQITEAKAWIGASLTGLVLALSSYLLLATVNPALVNLKITGISSVGKITHGCCLTNGKAKDTEKMACKGEFTENAISNNNKCLSYKPACCSFSSSEIVSGIAICGLNNRCCYEIKAGDCLDPFNRASLPDGTMKWYVENQLEKGPHLIQRQNSSCNNEDSCTDYGAPIVEGTMGCCAYEENGDDKALQITQGECSIKNGTFSINKIANWNKTICEAVQISF